MCVFYSPFIASLIYFCSVIMFLSDMSGRTPLYKKYVKDFYLVHVLICMVISSEFWVYYHFWCTFSFIWYVERAFVYFSSPISRELVAHIKKDSSVLPRISALSEVSFMFFRLAIVLEAICIVQTNHIVLSFFPYWLLSCQ